jgi:hypothetical protein
MDVNVCLFCVCIVLYYVASLLIIRPRSPIVRVKDITRVKKKSRPDKEL